MARLGVLVVTLVVIFAVTLVVTLVDRLTVSLTTNRGHKLQAFVDDAITNEIRDAGVYDHWTLSAIEHLLQRIDADVCLDVGANIGNHSVVMAQHCRQLHAFEPIPFIFEVLRKNLDINTTNVKAHCIALSNEQSLQNIYVDPAGNLGKSSMLNDNADSDNSIEISAVCGDEFLSGIKGSVDFVKIDVEGFEPRVVQGLQQTIVESQPVILLEWNSSQTRTGFAESDLFTRPLEGYRCYSLTHRKSKQVSGRGLTGAIKRAWVGATKSDGWCLRSFDLQRSYPNVLMIPRKWHSLVASMLQE